MQRGCLGLCGGRVDSIDFYKDQVKDLDKKVSPAFYVQLAQATHLS